MSYRIRRLVVPIAAMLSLGSQIAYAGAYRWVDEGGSVHYSDSVPTGQARLGYRVYDAEGRQISVVEAARTKEQLATALQQRALVDEQARRDRILLATFTSEEDLEYARNEHLATLESTLAIAQEKIAELQRQSAELDAQAASSSAEQESPSEDLARKRGAVRLKMSEIEVDVLAKEQQKQTIEDSFAADLARYRDLKAVR